MKQTQIFDQKSTPESPPASQEQNPGSMVTQPADSQKRMEAQQNQPQQLSLDQIAELPEVKKRWPGTAELMKVMMSHVIEQTQRLLKVRESRAVPVEGDDKFDENSTDKALVCALKAWGLARTKTKHFIDREALNRRIETVFPPPTVTAAGLEEGDSDGHDDQEKTETPD